MLTHQMNLHPGPFEMIRQGLKTVELRLNDEKRRAIRIGDRIVFTCSDDSAQQITVRVKELYRFASFEELYKKLPLDQCGYAPQELADASPRDMEAYYTPEQQRQFGVLGIEMELL